MVDFTKFHQSYFLDTEAIRLLQVLMNKLWRIWGNQPHRPIMRLITTAKQSTTKRSKCSYNAILTLFQSLWNLTGTLTTALPRCLSHFRAIPISLFQGSTRFGSKGSVRLVNRGPGHAFQAKPFRISNDSTVHSTLYKNHFRGSIYTTESHRGCKYEMWTNGWVFF